MSTLPVPVEPDPAARLRRVAVRLRVARIMQVAALAGAVLALVGAVIGWRLVGQIDRTVDDSLELTGETLVTLEDTIELADRVVASVDQGLSSTESSLDEVVVSFGEAEEVVVEVDQLVGTIGPTIDEIVVALLDLAEIGETIDVVLQQLDNIPFGPDYNPSRPLGAQFAAIAAELEPLGASLEITSDSLTEFVDGTSDLQVGLGELAGAVRAINSDLQDSRALLDAYLETARDARTLTTEARADLSGDVAATRILLVVGAIVFALAQLMPFWIGRELAIAARAELEG